MLGRLTPAEAAQEFCRFPDCKCPLDPGPAPDWCAKGLPHQAPKAGVPGLHTDQQQTPEKS